MYALVKRNIKELLRDPLSFVFCLGFPLVMLGLMTLVNRAIPPEAGSSVFSIELLTPGVAVFALSFCMLFGALTVSRDKSGALLMRLRATPLNPADYVGGYLLPLLTVAAAQTVVTLTAGAAVSFALDGSMSLWGLIRCGLSLIPAMVLFVCLGILFGTLFSDKAAPGICSVLISACSLLSGVWMDVAQLGGTIEKVCLTLPFYHCVRAGRWSLAGENALMPMAISGVWALLACVGAILALRRQLLHDL